MIFLGLVAVIVAGTVGRQVHQPVISPGRAHLIRDHGGYPASIAPEEDIRPAVEVSEYYVRNIDKACLAFTVTNARQAHNSIQIFGVKSVKKPVALWSPEHWWGMYRFEGTDSLMAWVCVDTLTQPGPNWNGNLLLSPYAIAPGDTSRTFRLYTDAVPPVINFYAQGFDTIGDSPNTYPNLVDVGWTGIIYLQDVAGIRSSGPPRLLDLGRATPNPAVGRTQVSLSLERRAVVDVAVYDARGAFVRRVAHGERDPGVHVFVWDARREDGGRASPGEYFVRVMVDGKPLGSRRVALLR